jgi:purine-binding chemotaxis protein CheW
LSTETPVPAELALAPDAALVGRACVVLLGGRPFAVDVTDAREVVVLETTTPVPGAPAAVIGVMNLRGNVLPVVEARPLLGLPV